MVENSRSRRIRANRRRRLFEGGFYEKPGLSVERWRRARDAETKEGTTNVT